MGEIPSYRLTNNERLGLVPAYPAQSVDLQPEEDPHSQQEVPQDVDRLPHLGPMPHSTA